jgi:hypothetical protein
MRTGTGVQLMWLRFTSVTHTYATYYLYIGNKRKRTLLRISIRCLVGGTGHAQCPLLDNPPGHFLLKQVCITDDFVISKMQDGLWRQHE